MKIKVVLFLVLAFSASIVYAANRKEYTVQKDDTLSDVMVVLRLKGVDVSKLHDWNPNLKMHTIYVGQKIVYFTPDVTPPPVSKEQAQAEANQIIKAISAQQKDGEQKSTRVMFAFIFIFLSVVSLLVAYSVRAGWVLRDQTAQTEKKDSSQHVEFPGPDAKPKEIIAFGERMGLPAFKIPTRLEKEKIVVMIRVVKENGTYVAMILKHKATLHNRRRLAADAIENLERMYNRLGTEQAEREKTVA